MNQRMMMSSLGLLTCTMLACDPGTLGAEPDLEVELDESEEEPEKPDEIETMNSEFSAQPDSLGVHTIKRKYEFVGHFDDSPALYNTRPVDVHATGRMAIASSYRTAPTADLDAHVTQVDYMGNVVWARRYGLQGTEERALSTMYTSSGDLLVVGSGDGRPLRFKLDAAGDVVWAYADLPFGGGKATAVAAHGADYVAAGSTPSGGSVLPFATRFADDGTLMWTNVFTPAAGWAVECEVSDIVEAGSNVYIVGTRKELATSAQSVFILTVEGSTGAALEMRVYPHLDPIAERAVQAPTLVETHNGFAVGYSVYVHGDGYRAAIAKLDVNLDPVGEIQYVSKSGTPGVREDLGLSLHVAQGGGLRLSTAHAEFGGLLYVDDSGAVMDSRLHGRVGQTFEHVGAAASIAGGYVLVAHADDAVHLSVVDSGGSSPCAANHDVESVNSTLLVAQVPLSTAISQNFASAYPLAIDDEVVSTSRSCE